YDPVERVVATLHPNHAWEKVVFDPWQQESWDVNDTVLRNPNVDEDVKSFFLRLPNVDYVPTWYEQRTSGALGAQEQDASNKAALHADTPSLAHADSLGRTFLPVAPNGFDHTATSLGGKYPTAAKRPTEGN